MNDSDSSSRMGDVRPRGLKVDRGGVGIAIPASFGGHNAGRDIKSIATGLLILMAALFAATHAVASRYPALEPALSFVRAFAEAAMVGGLADWFAVTALFRHPLGLPIPHTAIVPRNKDRIGDTLAQFIRDNFLVPRLIALRMRRIDVAGAIGKFLTDPSLSQGRMRNGASRLIADMIAYTVNTIPKWKPRSGSAGRHGQRGDCRSVAPPRYFPAARPIANRGDGRWPTSAIARRICRLGIAHIG